MQSKNLEYQNKSVIDLTREFIECKSSKSEQIKNILNKQSETDNNQKLIFSKIDKININIASMPWKTTLGIGTLLVIYKIVITFL